MVHKVENSLLLINFPISGHKVCPYDDQEVENPGFSQQVKPSNSFPGSGSTVCLFISSY